MFVVIDIEYLQLSSLQETIDIFLPSTNKVHIFFGCQWDLLLYEPLPNDIKVLWSRMESKSAEIYLNDYILNATKPDAEDELILIDPSFSFGRKILYTYNHTYKPSKVYEHV
jgi:hypothetical protein